MVLAVAIVYDFGYRHSFMYSVLTIGFGSIYLVYLHQSAIASWPKHGFSMSTFQRPFYNENSVGHFSVIDSVLRQMPRAYAEDVHGTSIKTLILVRRTFKDYWWQ